MVLETCRGMK